MERTENYMESESKIDMQRLRNTYAEQTLMPHFGGGEKASVEISSDSTKSLDPTGIHSALRARRARWSSLASVSAINSSSYAILNSKPDSSTKAGLGFAGPWDGSAAVDAGRFGGRPLGRLPGYSTGATSTVVGPRAPRAPLLGARDVAAPAPLEPELTGF